MKRSEAIKKIRELQTAVEVKHLEKLRQMEAEMDLENRESNRNRARSITVGTAFGGTAEIMMRGDGGRHLWCLMQPCEVVEFIHQLAANVGCNAQVTPRKDFSSWRDWRVSEVEKKHLNGHIPFPNDMAVFQQLGASGYNDEEAQKIMDALANLKQVHNENDDSKIIHQEHKGCAGPSVMIGEEDGLVHNKVAFLDNNKAYIMGGNGGDPAAFISKELENGKDTVAAKKTVNKRTTKRTARASS